MHRRRACALLLRFMLFMSGAAAKKQGKAKLRAMHSMVLKKRGRNATLPQLIKPHVLGSNDAWKNAKKLCDGSTRLQERRHDDPGNAETMERAA